jgi:hypothetical protein
MFHIYTHTHTQSDEKLNAKKKKNPCYSVAAACRMRRNY